jgi:hypothetical protein
MFVVARTLKAISATADRITRFMEVTPCYIDPMGKLRHLA